MLSNVDAFIHGFSERAKAYMSISDYIWSVFMGIVLWSERPHRPCAYNAGTLSQPRIPLFYVYLGPKDRYLFIRTYFGIVNIVNKIGELRQQKGNSIWNRIYNICSFIDSGI